MAWNSKKFWFLPDLKQEDVDRMCQENVLILQRMFSLCQKKCGNCGFPLENDTQHFVSMFCDGNICGLCHDMEFALLNPDKAKVKQWFIMVHKEWEVEQRKKNKIIEEGKKGDLS